MIKNTYRHCEEHSDVAIHKLPKNMDCFSPATPALAMTVAIKIYVHLWLIKFF